jgi:hypothetical protein
MNEMSCVRVAGRTYSYNAVASTKLYYCFMNFSLCFVFTRTNQSHTFIVRNDCYHMELDNDDFILMCVEWL